MVRRGEYDKLVGLRQTRYDRTREEPEKEIERRKTAQYTDRLLGDQALGAFLRGAAEDLAQLPFGRLQAAPVMPSAPPTRAARANEISRRGWRAPVRERGFPDQRRGQEQYRPRAAFDGDRVASDIATTSEPPLPHARAIGRDVGSIVRAIIPLICGSLSLESVDRVGSPSTCAGALGRASGGNCPARGAPSVRGDALTASDAASWAAFMLHAAKSSTVGTSARAGHAMRALNASPVKRAPIFTFKACLLRFAVDLAPEARVQLPCR